VDVPADFTDWPKAVADALAMALLLDAEGVRTAISGLAPQELGRLQHAAEMITRECGRARWASH
jgi:hypothetical protein